MNRALQGLLSLSILGGCSNGFGLQSFVTADSGPTESGLPDGVAGVAPTLSSFSAEEDGDRVRFTFRVSDPDGDLNGGLVRLNLGATEHSFDYPDQVNIAGNGSASVTVSADSLDRDRDYACTLVVIDRGDHRSDALNATLTLGPWSASVSEVGDTPADVSGIGLIEVPAIVSGDIYRAANAAGDYAADIDVVKFNVPTTGTYNVILQWTATGADYDLFLMETGPVTIDSSTASSTSPPELTSATLRAGADYYFAVGGWSGPAGAWTVRIE